ncbi:MAG: dTDP-4-dehydrorhamnose reductase (EC [uncultured Sulfurovum sp.]|uniref:dTDP-4-dehydrorhamnose reductase n=1 Tax=uncultured Sulfurovum sp. TaxID=269237 RepID=A0A6S6TZF7_9BACT|nr:MAG: dTDP-4-dehydrorhamnose reductase (EC [uncultured Sulfurovum sp.]
MFLSMEQITMPNVLVTGSKGQLGSEIEVLSNNYAYNFFFTDKEELDIVNQKSINNFIELNDVSIIINCAAYTTVDKAEEEKELADKVNHRAVKYLAETSKEKNIQLIHISTDYVFDGCNFKPYLETDSTNPNGVYGQTKLDGEKIMLEINPKNSIIIRTSWVYSSFGVNFVKTMLKLGKERDALGVIFDQVGTPTYAKDLAKAILDILPKIDNEQVEVYNYSNEGVLSWYDFAKEIMRMAKIECTINPIETKEYPTPAKRPHYSLLNKSKIKKEFDLQIPFWKDSVDECLKVMGERK